MRKFLILPFLFFLPLAVFGQTTQPVSYDNSGFHFGSSLTGSTWSLENVYADRNTGGGIGLNMGYNLNTNFGLFTSIDFSRIDDYDVTHLNLGIKSYFRTIENRLRPYVSAGLAGMRASMDYQKLNGIGLGLSGGVLFFISERFALDIAYNQSWLNIDTGFIVDSPVIYSSEPSDEWQSPNIDESGTTGRINLGFKIYF